jgi:hypothetical protein
MEENKNCPCPNLNCPNHGYCDKCNSRHTRIGHLNYCAFNTILPTLKGVINEDPESPAAKKLDTLIGAQLQAYEKLMSENNLTQESQDRLLKKVAEYSDY